jgi:hypothetical protein
VIWEITLKIIGFFIVGFIEMFLATQRTYWISKGQSVKAASLVFFETFISFFIIYQVTNNFSGSWVLFTFYAAGNAIGTYVNLEKFP